MQSDKTEFDVELDFDEARLPQDTGFIGAYHLLRQIGSGAMGNVFLARSVHPTRVQQSVVVKVLAKSAAADPLQTEHSLSEAYLLSLLDHQNVIRTFESGVDDGWLYVVMEYADGPDLESLTAHLDERDLALPEAMVCDIFHQLLAGLEYVHAAKDGENKPLALVHRDLCPSNVFVSKSGGVRLGDFGIAVHAARAKSGRILHAGHLGYMAPEQLQGKTPDQRSDLFAAVAVLVKLFLHRAPFDEADQQKSFADTKNGPDLSALPGPIRKKLGPIVERGLAFNPKKRFQSAGELREFFSESFGPPTTRSRPALRALLNELRPDEEQSERRTPLREVALVSSNEQEHTALLEAAGYSCLPVANTSVLSPATGLPVVIDLGGADIAQVNRLGLQLLIGLMGPLNGESLARATELRAHVLAFAPYHPQRLALALERELAWRLERRDASAQARKAPGRRVLLVGVPHALGDAIRAGLSSPSVTVEAFDDMPAALGRERLRSYHLVVRAARKLDATGLGEVAAFRKQLGYELVPFLMWLDEPPGLTLRLSRLPPQLTCVPRNVQADVLCHKIEQTLASFSQRAFVRFAVRVPIEYSYRGVGAPATLVNVGRLGALLHCRQMLHVGDRVTLSIAFREQRFSLTPVVAHLRVDENAARSGDFFIGLDFADIAPTAEANWLSVLGELVQTSAGDGAQRK